MSAVRKVLIRLYENGAEIAEQSVFLIEDTDNATETIKSEERQIGLGAQEAYRRHLAGSKRAYA